MRRSTKIAFQVEKFHLFKQDMPRVWRATRFLQCEFISYPDTDYNADVMLFW